jgi:outer membrane protein assembly factor BamB
VVARGPVAVAGRIGYVQPRAWVAGDVVVARVALDKLKAFKALTGEDAWEIEVKPGSPMCFPVVNGGIAYLTEGDSVTAIDLATQKRLWTTELANCTSLARGGQALVCQAGGKIVALDVSKKGEKLWDADLPEGGAGGGPALNVPVAKVRGFGGLVVDDSRVYMVAGDEMVTYDLKKGEKASSKLDLTLPEEGAKEGAAAGDGVGTVVVGPGGGAGGMVVIQGGGNVMMTSASGGLMRWTASGGMVYAATNKGLFAFDGKSGQRLWLLTINQRLSGDPVVAGGAIFFGTMRAYGPAAAPDEKALPKDLPGLHAVKLKEVAATPTTAPAAAPAKAPDGKP